MVASSWPCCQKSLFPPGWLLALGEYTPLSAHTLEGLDHYYCKKLKSVNTWIEFPEVVEMSVQACVVATKYI